MFKLPFTFNRRRALAEESDGGRRFGWFIERDGERIGELDYLRWDSDSQFWHDYQVTWYRPEDAVVGPEEWIDAKLVLRNRRCTAVVADSFMTSLGCTAEVIKIRNASVPEELLCDERPIGYPPCECTHCPEESPDSMHRLAGCRSRNLPRPVMPRYGNSGGASTTCATPPAK